MRIFLRQRNGLMRATLGQGVIWTRLNRSEYVWALGHGLSSQQKWESPCYYVLASISMIT